MKIQPNLSIRVAGTLAAVVLLAAAPVAQAVFRGKANNASNLNTTASWSVAVVPGVNDVGVWSNTVSGANAVELGGDLSFGGVAIFNPGGAVSISGSNVLTLGVFGVDLARSTRALSLTPDGLILMTNASVLLNVTNGLTLTFSPTNFVRSAGATLFATNVGTIATSVLTNDATGIVGTWARYGGGTNSAYATISAGIFTGVVGTAAAVAEEVVDAGGTTNYDVLATGVLGAGASFNTLRYLGAAGSVGGDFAANGLMNSGAGALGFSNNVTIGDSKELVIVSPDTTRAITLSGSVGDNGGGASGITIVGGGRVNLSASNSYSGLTVISAGSAGVTNADAMGTTNGGTVIFSTGSLNNGGQLSLSGGVSIAEPILIQGPGDGAFLSYNGAVISASGTNTVTGTVTLSGNMTYRIGATAAGAVLNLGLVQRSSISGGNLLIDPVPGAVVNVNVPLDNNLGSLTCHAGGLVVLNAASNDVGFVAAQNGTSLKITASDALTKNQNLQIGQSVGVNGAGGVNNDVGAFILDGVSQTINSLIGSTNSGANATTSDKRRVFNSGTNAVTLTVGNGNGGSTFDGVLEDGTNGGTLAFTKVGSGTQTLTGSRPNTHTGQTTVNGGTLNLNKLTGTNAVGGNILIGAGTNVNQRAHQIPDYATVTMNSTNAMWNLGGFAETIANLDMQNAGPIVNIGFASGTAGKLTITGTLTHTLGNITINSSGAGGQSILDVNALVNMGGSWTFGVTSGTQSLHVASGGLTIGGGSVLLVDANGGSPNFVNLNGDVSSLAAASSNVISGPGRLLLNNTRTFTVADGAASNDLTLALALVDGSNVGTLVKSGPGLLNLTGANLYSGGTVLSGGTLAISTFTNLPMTGPLTFSGGALQINGTGITSLDRWSVNWSSFSGGLDIASSTVSFLITNEVTGAGGITKSGAGTLVLAATNTYAGTTLVNAGTLLLPHTNALPGWDTPGRFLVGSNATLLVVNDFSNATVDVLLGTGNFAAGATFGFDTSAGNRTYNLAITNTANGVLNIVKGGTNILTLTGTNTYDGLTTITRGTLLVNNPAALGTTNGGTVINATGSINTGGQLVLSGGITLAEPLAFVGSGDASPFIQSLRVSTGTNTLTGAITIGTVGSTRITAGGAGTVLNINATITRTNGTGNMLLGASGVGGLLVVNQPINLNGGGISLHNGAGTILFNTAGHNIGDMNVQYLHTFKLGITDALPTNRNVALGFVATDSNAERGAFDLAGFNQTINLLLGNGTNAAAHPATRAVTNSTATLSTLTLGSANATGTFNGVIVGNIALTKIGTGLQTLTGTNTFTGPTTILGGTLALTGNCALVSSSIVIGAGANLSVTGRTDSTLTLAADQTLSGSGTLHGSLTTDGTIAPGQSAGTLTITGDFVMPSGTLALELGGTTPGTGHDSVTVGGTAAVVGGLTVSLINAYAPTAGSTFLIFQAASVAGTFGSPALPTLADPNLGWDITYSPTSVLLSVTGTPSTATGYTAYSNQFALTQGETGDDDTDGYANLYEYVTGSNPTNGSSGNALTAARTNGMFALKFLRETNSTDATLIIEGSYATTNDADWTGFATNINGSWGSATNVIEDANNPAAVTAYDVAPAATNRFLRLRITRP